MALLAGCGGGEKPKQPLPSAPPTLRLESPAFHDGGSIPKRFTCDGEGSSPPLRWSRIPRGASGFALIVEDRDADRFVHWALLGIPSSARALREGGIPGGAVEAKNSFGKRGWGGPCPPEGDGPHRYVFALYALRHPVRLGGDASPDEIRTAVGKAALARGVLTGRYDR